MKYLSIRVPESLHEDVGDLARLLDTPHQKLWQEAMRRDIERRCKEDPKLGTAMESLRAYRRPSAP